ncbi:DUF3800 domain-containing protein [Paenibacillus sp. DMB5]|uniref:DUF3800 domain-containing protein n=1 Tax=Paenibacillus sp. DMB5 TaxID=1780103 RepID=UPI00076BDB33|nr:DUF3800 domain-containing protein [Paenibacillus sp. DMB5]KUP23765.1 hypothetical protein AWJ19_09985 [Paenibacillus sp. DMB5]
MNASFYIDESGNTGTNWDDKTQPYFVYGGWLVPDDRKEEAVNYLNGILASIQGSELKAKSFLKGKSGTYRFYNLFKKLVIEFGFLPFFGVTDKKFMIAAKIVETFFDCDYNPNVNDYLSRPVELKKALAVCIFQDEQVMQNFSTLIKNGTVTIDLMKKINEQLIQIFQDQNQEKVADTLKSLSDENLSKMIKEFEVLTSNGTRMRHIALTGTMLIELLKNIEFYSAMQKSYVSVYHDNLRNYDDVFNDLRSKFLHKAVPSIFGTDSKPFLSNFPHIDSLMLLNSKDEILIQAADLLCGFVSKTFQEIATKKRIDDNSIIVFQFLAHLYDMFNDVGIKLWNLYGEYQFLTDFLSAIFQNAEFSSEDHLSIIDAEFPLALNK